MARASARQLAGVTKAKRLEQVAQVLTSRQHMPAVPFSPKVQPSLSGSTHDVVHRVTIMSGFQNADMHAVHMLMHARSDAALRTHMVSCAGRSPKIGFEGGQTPLRQRVPKRGFRNPSALNYVPLNLTKLMKCVETKQLDASQVCMLARSDTETLAVQM